MPLSKRKLAVYQRYYKTKLHPIREFDSTHHPVVLMRQSQQKKPSRKDSWLTLMCPCDLKWKWETFGKSPRRIMVMTGDGYNCPEKERAREVVRKEVRTKYGATWCNMPLADAVHDIWLKHRAGEYMGEHNIGMPYVQDLECMLGTTPDNIAFQLDEKVEYVSFPSSTILSAVGELRKRKLLDLSGMILVPYKESFRFPDELHHQFAHWIEEPLGWPNGDAGDCFMSELYRRIQEVTGWTSGEFIFGKENIPNLSQESVLKSKGWIVLLDNRLADKEVKDKSAILRGVSLFVWKQWLLAIARKLSK